MGIDSPGRAFLSDGSVGVALPPSCGMNETNKSTIICLSKEKSTIVQKLAGDVTECIQ